MSNVSRETLDILFYLSIMINMKKKTRRLTEIAIFSALVVLLQVLATSINFGSFPITLTLIPIIVAGCVYGEGIGAFLGLVFGVVVSTMVITGADPSGATMFSSHPIITVSTCLVKGTLAGYISALVYRKLKSNNEKVKVVIAAAMCPIINTLTFYIALMLFFDASLKALIGAFLSVNFVIELLINILLAPGLTGLILRNKKRYEN